MRNEVEHPSNPTLLIIENYRLIGIRIQLPQWQFNGEKYYILDDMIFLIEQALSFTEELFIYLVLKIGNSPFLINIKEIPLKSRNLEIPIRFEVNAFLSQEMFPKNTDISE